MRRFSLLACLLLSAVAAGPLTSQGVARAGGGQGNSYCSNATGPNSGTTPFRAGKFGSFANPGDVVSTLVGILWGQGVGAPSPEPGFFTRTVCNTAPR